MRLDQHVANRDFVPQVRALVAMTRILVGADVEPERYVRGTDSWGNPVWARRCRTVLPAESVQVPKSDVARLTEPGFIVPRDAARPAEVSDDEAAAVADRWGGYELKSVSSARSTAVFEGPSARSVQQEQGATLAVFRAPSPHRGLAEIARTKRYRVAGGESPGARNPLGRAVRIARPFLCAP